MNKELLNKLENVVKNSNLCTIKRENIDTNPIHGFPVQYDSQFVLVEYEYDFQMDGYKIIRTKDITELRQGTIEEFVENIFAKEGIPHHIDTCIVNIIGGFQEFFSQFQKKDSTVIIECEACEENKFLIGKIIKIGEEYVDIICFDALGKWDESEIRVEYQDITCITFESRYINIMSRYTVNRLRNRI